MKALSTCQELNLITREPEVGNMGSSSEDYDDDDSQDSDYDDDGSHQLDDVEGDDGLSMDENMEGLEDIAKSGEEVEHDPKLHGF